MVKVGFIGTGLMGLPMAQRLLDFGESFTVYNRTATKLVPLEAMGATIVSSGTDVFAQSEVVVLMLTDASAIAALLFPPHQPEITLPGRTIIQMGTIAPAESQDLRDRVVAAGGAYLEAPVLGSIPEAKAGELIIMVGAEPAQFLQWLPLLQKLGNSTLVGPVGSAATIKLALNQLIGSLTTAFGLSLALVQRADVDPAVFMQILRDSALYAPTFDKKLSRMLNQNYDHPNFPTKHLLKDMHLFAQAAAREGIPTITIDAIATLLAQTIAAGRGEADYAAIFHTLATPLPESPLAQPDT
jgi:3-hydroxyisobutyrate dehydrogenase